jgi:hypothetical protein
LNLTGNFGSILGECSDEIRGLTRYCLASRVLRRLRANFPIGMLDSGETPSVVYSRIHHAYLIVWRNDNDIVARLLSETGNVMENTLLITKRGTAVSGPRTVQNTKTGKFLVVWPDNRNFSKGRQDIFAQLIHVKREAREVCCKD